MSHQTYIDYVEIVHISNDYTTTKLITEAGEEITGKPIFLDIPTSIIPIEKRKFKERFKIKRNSFNQSQSASAESIRKILSNAIEFLNE